MAQTVESMSRQISAYQSELNRLKKEQEEIKSKGGNYQVYDALINNQKNNISQAEQALNQLQTQQVIKSGGGLVSETYSESLFGATTTTQTLADGSTIMTDTSRSKVGATPSETVLAPLVRKLINPPQGFDTGLYKGVYGKDYVAYLDPNTGETKFSTPQAIKEYESQIWQQPVAGAIGTFSIPITKTTTYTPAKTKTKEVPGTVGTLTTLELANKEVGLQGIKTFPQIGYELSYGLTPFLSDSSRQDFAYGVKSVFRGFSNVLAIPSNIIDFININRKTPMVEGKGRRLLKEFFEVGVYEPVPSFVDERSIFASELIGGLIGGEVLSKGINVGVTAFQRTQIPSITSIKPSFVISKSPSSSLYRADVKTELVLDTGKSVYAKEVSFITKPKIVKGQTYNLISSVEPLSGTSTTSLLSKSSKAGISKISSFISKGEVYQIGRVYTFKGTNPPIIMSGIAEIPISGSLGLKSFVPVKGLGIDLIKVSTTTSGGFGGGSTFSKVGSKTVSEQFVGEISKIVNQQVGTTQKVVSVGSKTVSEQFVGEISKIVSQQVGTTQKVVSVGVDLKGVPSLLGGASSFSKTSIKTDIKPFATVMSGVITPLLTKTFISSKISIVSLTKQRSAQELKSITDSSPVLKTISSSGTKVSEALIVDEIALTKEAIKTKSLINIDVVNLTPAVNVFTTVGFGGGGLGGGLFDLPDYGSGYQRSGITTAQPVSLKKGYSPDIKSVLFSIMGDKPLETMTGFEDRPVLGKKKKRLDDVFSFDIIGISNKSKKGREVMTL